MRFGDWFECFTRASFEVSKRGQGAQSYLFKLSCNTVLYDNRLIIALQYVQTQQILRVPIIWTEVKCYGSSTSLVAKQITCQSGDEARQKGVIWCLNVRRVHVGVDGSARHSSKMDLDDDALGAIVRFSTAWACRSRITFLLFFWWSKRRDRKRAHVIIPTSPHEPYSLIVSCIHYWSYPWSLRVLDRDKDEQRRGEGGWTCVWVCHWRVWICSSILNVIL